MYRAVVSGVTGHLGRELAAQLVAAGVDVHGLTRQENTCLQVRNAAIRLHQVDGSTEGLVATFRALRPDVLFHLAAITRREHQTSDVAAFVDTNVLFGTQLLEAMRWSECVRLVLAGSYLQHFDTDGYRAFNLYAATKQAFEDIVVFYLDAFQLSAIRLTFSDIYSEHDTRPKLMTDIARAWATRTPLKLQAEEAWIDPIHVEDAASACLQAATLLKGSSALSGSLARYSVSSECDVSATQLARLFEELGGRQITVQRATRQNSLRTIRPRRGTALPGWTPRISLHQGIARILAQC
jgi:nucleoside-diphosphate-sugar epimerase